MRSFAEPAALDAAFNRCLLTQAVIDEKRKRLLSGSSALVNGPLNAKSLTVEQTTTLKGDASFESNAHVLGELTATGDATFGKATLNIAEASTLTAGAADVSGALRVLASGSSTFDSDVTLNAAGT